MTRLLRDVRVHRPRTIGAALRLMRDHAPLIPIAGCTDVFVGLHAGVDAAPAYLDLWGLDPLRGITQEDDKLRIGALTTWTTIADDPLVQRHLPMLAQAAREVGSIQIQNRGTIGGNVANASPAGDSLPVLAAADACVELRHVDWIRTVPVCSFFPAYRRTVRRLDELVTAVIIPPVSGTQWFRKVGTRAAQAISKVVLAGVRGSTVQLAAGSVAPTVVRLSRTEAALTTGCSLDDACRLLQEEIAPIDDVRSTAAYRREVAANLLRQFWTETAPRRPAPRGRRAT